ncbi:MAG: sulfatase [Candidatus Binatia bacterium]
MKPNPRYAIGLCGTILFLLGLFLPGGCNPTDQGSRITEKADSARPNVIFILIDTLRPDRLGCYGYRRDNSPTIDALAKEGVLFERAISAAPWTQPSIASLFAAVYPGVHGVIGYRKAYQGVKDKTKTVTVFADSFQTLAESFQGAGYATAAIVANPFLVKGFGFAQGFDHYNDTITDNWVTGDIVNQAALAWLIKQDKKKPFFLYLHYMDAHGPYAAPPKFLDPLLDDLEREGVKEKLSPEAIQKLDYLWQPPTGPTDLARHNKLSLYREYWSARYEAGIRQVDFHLQQLREELIKLGLWKDAYIILTADHGEALYEHGLWDHGFSAYHTDLHVPLILRWPGTIPEGRRIHALARLIDLAPTLVTQLHLSPMTHIQGTSLLPIIQGRSTGEAPPVAFAESVKIGPEQRAVYAGAWKLLLFVDTGEVKLFQIDRDPLEQKDLAETHPKLTSELRDILNEQHEQNKKLSQGVPTQRATLTDEPIKRLRSLGYLGE